MFSTIAWATDGSDLADAALELACELAGAHDARIVAVHASELFRDGRFGASPLFADELTLRARLEAQVEDLRARGFDAELRLEGNSRPATAQLIADAAASVGADLVVLATHGRGSAASVTIGGVARELCELSECPVLVVPAVAERALLARTGS